MDEVELQTLQQVQVEKLEFLIYVKLPLSLEARDDL